MWLTVKRVLRPCLRRMLVGGPRLWLWAIARLVLFPCFALHLTVALLTLALVEDKSMHLHRPPVFTTAAFFGVAALVDCCLFATVRTPRTQLQTRLFAKLCAGALLSDALLTAFLRSAAELREQLAAQTEERRLRGQRAQLATEEQRVRASRLKEEAQRTAVATSERRAPDEGEHT